MKCQQIDIIMINIITSKSNALCCPQNTDEAPCLSEAGSDCTYIADPNLSVLVAAGYECVSSVYAICEAADPKKPPGCNTMDYNITFNTTTIYYI